jgi:hypothetical protein
VWRRKKKSSTLDVDGRGALIPYKEQRLGERHCPSQEVVGVNIYSRYLTYKADYGI